MAGCHRGLESNPEMTDRRIIAVDPGANGAIVVSDKSGTSKWWRMPEIGQYLPLLRSVKTDRAIFVIEAQSGAGSVRTNPVMMFRFGMRYGAWLIAAQAAGIEMHAVTPQRWMSGLNLGFVGNLKADQRKGLKQAEVDRRNATAKRNWKNHLKDVATELYPKTKVILDNADALLIAEYARRFIA